MGSGIDSVKSFGEVLGPVPALEAATSIIEAVEVVAIDDSKSWERFLLVGDVFEI